MSTLTFVQRNNTLVQGLCRTLGYCAFILAGGFVVTHLAFGWFLALCTLGHLLVCASEVFDRPEWKSGKAVA